MIDQVAILRLIHEGYERRDIDFKKSIPWDKETKYNLIKDILAFANFGGGYIVIGYDEKAPTLQHRRAGIAEEHLKTWETTMVNDSVNEFSGPPLDIQVIEVEDSQERKKYIVLRVPAHGRVPHICLKNKHDSNSNLILRKAALYYRTSNKASTEISDPSDYNELIRECVLNRKQEFVRDIEQLLKGALLNPAELQERDIDPFQLMGGFYARAEEYRPEAAEELPIKQIICYPATDWKSFSIADVENALSAACVDYRGWPFVFYMRNSKVPPEYGEDLIFAKSNEPFYTRLKFDYWAFDYGKGIFYAQNLTDESSLGNPEKFDPFMQVRLIAEAIIAQGRIYSSLGVAFDEPLQFAVRYAPMKGVSVGSLGDYVRTYPSADYTGSALTYSRTEKLARFLNEPGKFAADIITDLTAKMGHSPIVKYAVYVKWAEEHLAKGQKVSL